MVDKHTWDAAVAKYAPSTGAYLHCWAWGEVQKASGHVVERVYVDGTHGVMLAQCVETPLPWPGPLKKFFPPSYVFVPRGPIGTMNVDIALEYLRNHFKGKTAFVKVEPVATPSVGQRVDHRHPEATRIINLTYGFDAIEKGMKQKTRYNMKLGERKGVTVRVGGAELLPEYMRLAKETTTRGGFHGHAEERYRAILEHGNDETMQAFVAVAEYDGQVLAANIMIDAFGVRTYLHGASGNAHREVMAPFVLHGWLLRDAIAKGLVAYDMWGIAPPNSTDNHPWAGITRFKDGFGGDVVLSPGTFDVAVNVPATTLYHAIRSLRAKLRR